MRRSYSVPMKVPLVAERRKEIGAIPGGGRARQPIGAERRIDPEIFERRKLEARLGRFDIVPGDIVVARERLVEAIEDVEGLIGTVERTVVARAIGVVGADPRLPGMI